MVLEQPDPPRRIPIPTKSVAPEPSVTQSPIAVPDLAAEIKRLDESLAAQRKEILELRENQEMDEEIISKVATSFFHFQFNELG